MKYIGIHDAFSNAIGISTVQKKNFFIFLLFISCLGLFLRLNHYASIPPFGETSDEFIYPWAGMSLLQTGTPVSWSPFGSYPTKYIESHWGKTFSMVSPYIEKPFLYPLLTGSFMFLNGVTEFRDVRLELLRMIPIGLSVISIFLLGLLVKKAINEKTALLATLIYATTPTIILGNRLSLTENLLIPIILAGLYITIQLLQNNQNSPQPSLMKRGSQLAPFSTFSTFSTFTTFQKWSIHAIGLLCGLAINTKQIGISLPISILIIFITQKQWRYAFMIGIYSIAFSLIHPITAWLYDWQTYIGVTEELRQAHVLGLPEALYTLFRFPGIGHKESLFLDGMMLLGWILLFASPFMKFKNDNNEIYSSSDPDNHKISNEIGRIEKFSTLSSRSASWRISNNIQNILLFPFVYVLFIVLGQGGQTWYGWHLFPLYPFIAIIVAYTIIQFIENPSIAGLILFLATLGASGLRFFLLIQKTVSWQNPLILVTGIFCVLFTLFQFKKYSWLNPGWWLIALLLLVNVYTAINLDQIYPSAIQPI